MALLPQQTVPGVTRLTKLAVWPDGITATRGALARAAGYPANTSTNAANAEVSGAHLALIGTYTPSAAPTQSGSIASHAVGAWTIDATPPDFQPGDVLEYMSQANYNNGTNTDDALLAAGLIPLAVYVSGGSTIVLLYNTTGAGVETPAGFVPNFLLLRVVSNNLPKID